MDLNQFIDNSPELRAYWEGVAGGILLLPFCRDCRRSHWYPRGMCPHCFSMEVEPRPATGQGFVYSFSSTPSDTSAIAYVTLDEGPTLLTRIVESDLNGLSIGTRVQVVFRQVPGEASLPLFARI